MIEKNDFFEIKLFRPEMVSPDNNNQDIESPRSISVDYGRLRLITVDYGRLGNDKKDVLIYLLDHGSIARKKVMELLDSKSSKATDLLAEMVEENLITRKGSGRGTYYVLKK